MCLGASARRDRTAGARAVGHSGRTHGAGRIDYRLSPGPGALGFQLSQEDTMTSPPITRTRRTRELIHEGDYLAEVDVELIVTDDGWSPYLSADDARKLDEVRRALMR